ncbi:MAG: NAD(P)H dehydrogenase, partial [Actinomycetota bacterium]|nr:NAD(P)H dehydrogenase [Actinomycetota bacterium]
CEVRLRRLPSLAGAGARAGAGAGVRTETGTELPVATAADLTWADGLAWGMSSAHGSLPASVAYFIERSQTILPAADYLNKVVTAFGATANAHCGGESMLLSLYTAMHHWDALIAAPGYTDPAVFAAGGNPYGTLHLDRNGPTLDQALASARFQGGRLAGLTRWIGGLDPGA